MTLVWIPGHTGLEGNERADALAKPGTEAEFKRSQPGPRKLYGLRHSKAMIDYPLKKVFIDNLLEFDRLQLRTLVGIYTGHCGVRHHMHRIGLTENAECRLS